MNLTASSGAQHVKATCAQNNKVDTELLADGSSGAKAANGIKILRGGGTRGTNSVKYVTNDKCEHTEGTLLACPPVLPRCRKAKKRRFSAKHLRRSRGVYNCRPVSHKIMQCMLLLVQCTDVCADVTELSGACSNS